LSTVTATSAAVPEIQSRSFQQRRRRQQSPVPGLA
jgi:hypothetical protein